MGLLRMMTTDLIGKSMALRVARVKEKAKRQKKLKTFASNFVHVPRV